MARPAIKIEPGERFWRLVVLRRAGTVDNHAVWRCACDCGKQCVITGSALKHGKTKSCGCWRREMPTITKTKHGHARTSGRSRSYRTWLAMRNRCLNQNSVNYERYGGRGITVCPEWAGSFEAFYRDMGDPPSDNHSIERKDNSIGYELGNCCWATAKEQAGNKRPMRKYHRNPETVPVGEDHHAARLTADAVREIRAGGKKLREFAEQYGVSLMAVKAARYGKTWKHIA